MKEKLAKFTFNHVICSPFYRVTTKSDIDNGKPEPYSRRTAAGEHCRKG